MRLSTLIRAPRPVCAPLVLNPLMAKMAEVAGFQVGYVGGGAMGHVKACTEANLTLTEMCQTAVDIRAVSTLGLILDGACGYGEPMHMHRTIGMVEAAGYEAIEIEDQIYPKRAHHHIGIEHMVPMEMMVAKIKEATAARRNRDFLIIGRTNAARVSDMDDALRRGEAYLKAGADVLFVALTYRPEQLRKISERLGGPFMFISGRGGLAGMGMNLEDFGNLGYKIIAESMAPVLAAYEAWKAIYEDLANGFGATKSQQPHGGPVGRGPAEESMLATIGLQKLIDIERATVEKPS